MVKISSSKLEEEIKKIISRLEDLQEVSKRIEKLGSRLAKAIEHSIDEATRSKKRITFEIPITNSLFAEIKTSPAVFAIHISGENPRPPPPWRCLPGCDWSFRTFHVLKIFVENFDNFFQNLVRFRTECEKENKEAKEVLEKLEKLFAPLLITSSMKS